MSVVRSRTIVRTIQNERFLSGSAAFATWACFAKMLTPPPQHRGNGVSIYTQEWRRRRMTTNENPVGAVGVGERGRE